MKSTKPGLACLLRSAVVLLAGATLGSIARADDKPAQIPEEFRGTWHLRLTSDDGGKSYKAGDAKPLCEVTEKEVKFTRKVDFSAEKLAVKSVTKSDAKTDDKGPVTYQIVFEGGEVWKVSEISGSITAVIHKSEKDKLTETYRITVRKR